eukprot:TRINITY_DN2420_c5_g2_i2.p1 TRINITY_DN2420_c5_g2~~TRINITY_DN2420_c5_g2_i2.p1  ORF type:complete len:204 (-),score=50.10 TRINITY_DN2420_c5_g2_i2:95-706(-)
MKTEHEDRKAVAAALHHLAKVHFAILELSEAQEAIENAISYYKQVGDKVLDLAPALQTSAEVLAARGIIDEATQASQQSVKIYHEANDLHGEALAKGLLAYHDLLARFKQIEESPQDTSAESTVRIQEDWKLAAEAYDTMRKIRHREGEDTIASMIQELREKAETLQKKYGAATRKVWTFDQDTRTTTCKEYFDPLDPDEIQS